jgi:hypothetical protein
MLSAADVIRIRHVEILNGVEHAAAGRGRCSNVRLSLEAKPELH